MAQIDARIPLMARGMQLENPLSQMGNMLAVQGGMTQNKLAQMQLEAAQARQPLEMEKLRYAVEGARQSAAIRNALAARMGGQGAAPGGGNALAGGGMGLTGRMELPPEVQMMIASDDPGIRALGTAMAKQFEPRVVAKGGAIVGPTGVAYERPDIPEGTHMVDGVVQPRPGIPESIGAMKGAEERAKAGLDLVDVDLMVNGRSVGKVKMTREQAANAAAQQGGPFSIQQPRPAPPQAGPAGYPQVPPDMQAQRDQEAARIKAREMQPSGGGAIPSGVVLGSPPESQQAADREAAVAAARQGVEGSGGQRAADSEFGKEYSAFTAGGGFADAQKNIVQLDGALKALQSEDGITGMMVGLQPDAVLKRTNPRAFSVKQNIEEVVQRNLRIILGAQFTEKEGERLISRAYDPALPQEENAQRMARLVTQMKLGLEAKSDAMRYFERHGTLRGWGGKLPTITDFEAAVGRQGRGATPTTFDAMPDPAQYRGRRIRSDDGTTYRSDGQRWVRE